MTEARPKNKTITFRTTDWIEENISNMAKLERRSKSDMICVALEDWIEVMLTPGLFEEIRQKAVSRRGERLDAERLAEQAKPKK